jgi:hypothetical protein
MADVIGVPGTFIDLLAAGSVTSIAVPTTGVAYSQSFVLPRGCTFGWEVEFDSDGVVAVTVELEQSNIAPETEGSADDNFDIPVGKTAANGLLPSGSCIAKDKRYITAYSPVATIFGRLKFTGTGANAASTVCNVARVYAIKNL